MRRHRRRAGTEARHLRAARQGPARAHPAPLVRAPAERPDLREDRVALVDDVHVDVVRDRLAGVGEESVEVEHEGVHFDAAVGGGDEREGGGEVELLGGDRP